MMKGLCCIVFFTLHSSLFTSCTEDQLDSTSIFENDIAKRRDTPAFDRWLNKNFVDQYNIEFKYRFEDMETDFTYNLVPADRDKAIETAHVLLHGWLKAYEEIAGLDFTRRYVPKLIQLVGCVANVKGSYKLGTAEDGLKVTLYGVNNFRPSDADDLRNYFQIIHHEFVHILTHNKDYDVAFRTISDGKYVTGEWVSKGETDALKSGFINTYAMSEYNEDFAETLSFYLLYTPETWSQKMTIAGDEGSAIIGQKLDIVRSYMRSAWNIDIDQMRDILQRRVNDITSGQVDLKSLDEE